MKRKGVDPKYEIYYASYKKRKQDRRNDLRRNVVMMTTHKMYLPIPEVDVEGWERKIKIREAAEEEASKIWHHLLREWHRINDRQAIFVVYPFVYYAKDRVIYKIELTTFNAKAHKPWLKEICDKYAEEKNLQST